MNFGSGNPTRSHFSQMDQIEATSSGGKGFLGKAVSLISNYDDENNALKAVSISTAKPKSFSGADVFVTKRFGQLTQATNNGVGGYFKVPNINYSILERLADIWSSSFSGDSIESIKKVLAARTATTGFGNSDIEASLAEAASLIKSTPGNRVLAIDAGGWDDHFTLRSNFDRRAEGLANGLLALKASLGAAIWQKTTVLVMSEFGRKVDHNGAAGADHGRGGMALLLGGGISSGIFNNTNGNDLTHETAAFNRSLLLEGDSLPVKIRYQDVIKTILAQRMGVNNSAIFQDSEKILSNLFTTSNGGSV
jgi:uncharacterized protein (DUF1501 family)